MPSSSPAGRRPRGRLGDVAAVFGPLGWRAFGGPAVHVALMRRAVVGRRRWLEDAELGALFAACNLLPGPSSTQLALLLGRRRAGLPGMLLTAGLFIGPAVLFMLALGELYRHVGGGATSRHVLLGVEAAVVAIVVRAGVDLLPLAARRVESAVAAAGALVASLLAVTPLPILAGAALVGAAGFTVRGWRRPASPSSPAPAPESTAGGAGRLLAVAAAAPAATAGLGSLFLAFLKIGAVAFGSGYVLLPFLRAELVGGGFHLDDRVIADAFAAAQATPGPVYAAAAFLGVQVAGITGGVVAAVGIFLPSLVYVPLVDRVVVAVSRWPLLRAALDGVLAAVLGLIAAIAVQLGRASLLGLPEVLTAVAVLALLWVRPTWQPLAVLLGAAAGGVIAATA